MATKQHTYCAEGTISPLDLDHFTHSKIINYAWYWNFGTKIAMLKLGKPKSVMTVCKCRDDSQTKQVLSNSKFFYTIAQWLSYDTCNVPLT